MVIGYGPGWFTKTNRVARTQTRVAILVISSRTRSYGIPPGASLMTAGYSGNTICDDVPLNGFWTIVKPCPGRVALEQVGRTAELAAASDGTVAAPRSRAPPPG